MRNCARIAAFIIALALAPRTAARQPEILYTLPEVSDKPAINYSYFPSKEYAFVFRNWTVVPAATLAKVLRTTAANVNSLAADMGLPPQGKIDPRWQSMRGYITVLRRNWHLLPYGQLAELLGMTERQLAWRLIADDFLIVKLGQKPKCDSLTFTAPTPPQRRRARMIAGWTRELGNAPKSRKPRFDFYKELPKPARDSRGSNKGEGIRMAYSYSSEYGDPLLDKRLSSFPEELLRQLEAKGVNALWIHTLLSSLVPPEELFPGSDDYARRLKNLQRLVNRGRKYGIKFYFYTNEPRAVSASFFAKPSMSGLGGVREGDQQAFCTSDPRTLDWLERSYKFIFSRVKGLGGLFTITGSENLTFCASHGRQTDCPRCKSQSYDKLVADVNNAIARGARAGDPNANVIVWDWGWDDSYAERIIGRLDKEVRLMSVSEWELPVVRGGIASKVGEYSISAVGPGPRALAHWEMAHKAGLKTVAKVQVNTSWELGSFVSVPAMEQVCRHARNLAGRGVGDVMLCWSLGGYPTINMSAFQSVLSDTTLSLDAIADKSYGSAGALVRKAWHAFSEGMAEYPYNVGTLYNGPQLVAPANPFFLEPTGYRATMVGFPYDDLDSWRAIYPAEVYVSQFRKVAEGFRRGCGLLEQAAAVAGGGAASSLRTDLSRSKGEALHFRSVANQAEFTRLRNIRIGSHDEALRTECAQGMRRCAEDEAEVVREMIPLVREDPTIGYEASNQYVYIEQDLIEKYVNLRSVLAELDSIAQPAPAIQP